MQPYAGATFEGGLYRVHSAATHRTAQSAIDEAFPRHATRLHSFGFDWLGRVFALDNRRDVEGEPGIVMVDWGAGELLDINASFDAFHNQELVHDSDAALASTLWAEWLNHVGDRNSALRHDECVGYQVPLFLGGDDVVTNLEKTDSDVYWTLMAQMIRQVATQPEGTPVRRVIADRD